MASVIKIFHYKPPFGPNLPENKEEVKKQITRDAINTVVRVLADDEKWKNDALVDVENQQVIPLPIFYYLTPKEAEQIISLVSKHSKELGNKVKDIIQGN